MLRNRPAVLEAEAEAKRSRVKRNGVQAPDKAFNLLSASSRYW